MMINKSVAPSPTSSSHAKATQPQDAAPATCDVLARTTPDNEGRRLARSLARQLNLDPAAAQRLEQGAPVLVARDVPVAVGQRVYHLLKARGVAVIVRAREPSPISSIRPTLTSPTQHRRVQSPTPRSTRATTNNSATRQFSRRETFLISLSALANSVSIAIAQLVYFSLIGFTIGALIWHLVRHQHWIVSDMPWPFAVSYIIGGVALLAIGLMLLKTVAAPSAPLRLFRFGHVTRFPMITGPLREIIAKLDQAALRRDDAKSAATTWTIRGDLTLATHASVPLRGTLQLAPSPTTLDTAAAIAKACEEQAPGVFSRSLVAADLALFRLWYKAYIADGWDHAIDQRIARSRDTRAVLWLMLRAALMVGRLPALVAFWIANTLMARRCVWQSCSISARSSSTTSSPSPAFAPSPHAV